ncbi:MAG: DUF1156 domain-containing protein [Chloroflexi bacterium]|nr:DUF1156 domain-containing protein [Chloroflexota bacterium]MCL5076029.1 DUF1156 domain-containing protein [Chloroflexota bacterium]
MRYIERDLPIEGLNAIAEKEGNAKKPIYQIHKWWARRLGSVFRMLILATFTEWDDTLSPEENQRRLWNRFYSRNELKNKEGKPPIILDPFMGGGTTVVEALRLGCKVIGIDLNPVAWFVTKKEIDPVDFNALDAAFKHLESSVAPRIKHYYRTTCPRGHEADIMYVFWVKKVPCLACGEEVRLFPSFRIATRNDQHTVFCPQCYHIKGDVSSLDSQVECPECGTEYIPEEGYSGGGKYTCPACGQKETILKAVQRREGPPEAEMFALEYYCKVCGRGYKGVTGSDRALYEEARAEFQRLRDRLPFPRQAVPEGLKTRELLNHGYKYFYQMFNERQLLCLSLLLEEILKIEDENTREYMLLTLSDCTNFNNMFCRYDGTKQHSTDLFSRHAYWPTSQPVENNVWGTKLGRNTFVKTYEKLLQAKEYAIKPYELESLYNPARKVIGDSALSVVSDEQFDGSNTVLKAETSEDMSFIRQKVDAVITDPPYCDNVMYSELADFFYVWLRPALKDRYQCFETEISPRAREIVKNPARHDTSKKPGQADKDAEEFFFQGLTRVFRESHRVLRDDGPFVFTFHHKEPWAWKAVLHSIVEAGFYVTVVYPVHAEMKTSTHLLETGGIAYDIPFVCRKRLEEPRRVAWESLKDEIYARVEETVASIRRSGRRISDSDLFVIAMGRCLEVYSKHWPNVMQGGQPVDVDTAVDEIEAMVDSFIKSHELKLLPAGLDEITQLYLLYVAGERGLTWDDLRKRFTTGGGFSLEEFNRRQYLEERKGRTLVPMAPSKRLEFIEKEIERGRPLPLIDVVHYLYSVLESGLDIRPELERWRRDGLVQVLDLLYKKTGVRVYDRLREHAEAVGAGQRRLM